MYNTILTVSLLAASQLASAQITQVFDGSTRIVDASTGFNPLEGTTVTIGSLSRTTALPGALSGIGQTITGGITGSNNVYITDVIGSSTYIENPSTTIGVKPGATTTAPTSGSSSGTASAAASTSSGAANKFEYQAAQILGGVAVGAFALL